MHSVTHVKRQKGPHECIARTMFGCARDKAKFTRYCQAMQMAIQVERILVGKASALMMYGATAHEKL